MATMEELESALIKADAAGNADDARVFANEIRRLRAQGQAMPQQTTIEEPALRQRPPAQGFFEKGGAVNKFAEGVVRGDVQRGVRQGLGQAGLGLAQLLTEGGLVAPIKQLIGAPEAAATKQLGQVAAERQKAFSGSQAGQGSAGKFGQMVGETAPAMAIPGGAATALGRLGLAAVGGAAAGGLQPVTSGDFATEKAKQAGTGAAIGLVGQGIAGEPLRAVVGRAASLAGGGTPNVSQEAQQALRFAEDRRLPIYADDVMGSPIARGAGVFVDDVPIIGGSGVRKAQSEAAANEAAQFANRFPGSSKGPTETLKESAQAQLDRARGIKNKLYTEAFGELNQMGDFGLPRTKLFAWNAIQAEQNKGTLADQGLIRELQKYVEAPDFNFEGWHGARSELGALIRSKRTGENSVLSDRAGSVLQQVKKAMDSELNTVADHSGASQAWKRADNFYRTVMPQYRRGVVASMLKSPDPDAIANRILGGRDSEGIAKQVYGALDKTGRAEVRSSLVSQALERSMKQVEGGDQVFSPGQFAKELDSIRERTGVFFSKADKTELDGLRNYMSFIRRSGQYASNPQTGRRLLSHLGIMAGAGAVDGKAAIGYAAVAGTTKYLLRTTSGRNLLLRLGSQSQGSKAAENTMQLINSFVQREAAADAAKQNGTLDLGLVTKTRAEAAQDRR